MAMTLPRLDVRRLALSLVIAASLVALWFAVTSAETGDTGLGPNDPGIETISPKPDELVLRQTQVVVDLAPGYRGDLYIDSQQIPVFDVVNDDTSEGSPPVRVDAVYDQAQNTITFTPTEGSTIEELTPGPHRVTVSFWKLDESSANARNYSWSFRVQG